MKKESSVFIVLEKDEVLDILHSYIKRRGLLKDIPKSTDPVPFDDIGQISMEYHWEEEIE